MRQNPLLLLSRVGITFVFAKFVSDVLQMTRNMRTEIWIMTDQSELPRLTLSICAELNLSLPEDLDPISMSLRFGPISSQLAELLFRLNFVSESVAFDVPQPIASTYLYLMHQQPCIQLQSRYFSLKGVLYGWRLYNLSGWRVGPHAENQVLFEQSQLFDTPRHNQHRLAWIRLLQLVDKTGLWTANCSYPLVRTPFQRVFTNNMHRTTARQLAAALLNDLFRMHMHSVAEWKKLRAKIDATMLSNIEQKKQQFMSSAVNTDIGMVDKPPGFCECSEWPNPICKVNIIYTQMGYIRNLNMLHTVPKVNNQSVTSVQSMFVIPFFARFQIDSMIGWKLAGVYLISMAATFFGISLLRIQFVVGKFIHRAYELKRIAWLCFFSIWPRYVITIKNFSFIIYLFVIVSPMCCFKTKVVYPTVLNR